MALCLTVVGMRERPKESSHSIRYCLDSIRHSANSIHKKNNMSLSACYISFSLSYVPAATDLCSSDLNT